MKSAFAALVGRPSSGKSTLLNALCGRKVSIVSPVPQTTRNQVRGIVNRTDRGQLVFLDTPGIHLSDKKFNQAMMENVTSALDTADVVLYLCDVSRPPGAEEKSVIDRLKTVGKPLVAVLNKTDVQPNHVAEFLLILDRELKPSKILKISALKEEGLDDVLAAVFDAASDGPAFYPDEFYTDQHPDFRVAEIIRETAINRLKEEIPHAVYVEVEDLEISEDEAKMWIRAVIYVERNSQIGIVVGQGGSQIKEIRQVSQKELGKIFSQRIHLDLRVKASPKWRSTDSLLKRLLHPEN